MNRIQSGVLFLVLILIFGLTACSGAANSSLEEGSGESQTATAGPATIELPDIENSDAEAFPSFSTQTMDGETVSNTVFADARLTMINIWATYCPPCIEEMPALGKMAASMPEGSQLLGLVIDHQGNEELAAQILSESKATFPQLIPDTGLMEYLMTVTAVPTTVFVDAQGNLVGEPVVGMQSEEKYRMEIEQRLATLGA